MNTEQKLTPKYWVVHDTVTDDVFIDTARKGVMAAIDAFLDLHSYDYFGTVSDEEAAALYYEHPSLTYSLVEIKLVGELE
jgi:hypothetical protein